MNDRKAYKALIDGLVSLRPSVHAQRVRQGVWHREPPPDQVKFNEVLGRLPKADRDVLAEIVQKAADAAVHDSLVFMLDHGYQFTREGQPVAQQPFDTDPHFDFMARIAGTPWPDESPPGPPKKKGGKRPKGRK